MVRLIVDSEQCGGWCCGWWIVGGEMEYGGWTVESVVNSEQRGGRWTVQWMVFGEKCCRWMMADGGFLDDKKGVVDGGKPV